MKCMKLLGNSHYLSEISVAVMILLIREVPVFCKISVKSFYGMIKDA